MATVFANTETGSDESTESSAKVWIDASSPNRKTTSLPWISTGTTVAVLRFGRA
jgi:hypothetical protein